MARTRATRKRRGILGFMLWLPWLVLRSGATLWSAVALALAGPALVRRLILGHVSRDVRRDSMVGGGRTAPAAGWEAAPESEPNAAFEDAPQPPNPGSTGERTASLPLEPAQHSAALSVVDWSTVVDTREVPGDDAIPADETSSPGETETVSPFDDPDSLSGQGSVAEGDGNAWPRPTTAASHGTEPGGTPTDDRPDEDVAPRDAAPPWRDGGEAGVKPEDPPRPAKRHRVYYGWVIAIAAAAAFAVSSGIGNWGFGAFVRPLENEFGWSRGEVSVAASIGMFAILLASPLVGAWIDRWGPRSAIVVGSIFTGAGFAGLSLVQERWQFYVLFGATGFFRSWTTYVPLAALVSRWFPENSSRAMGIVMAGLGLGGVVFAPVATLLIDAVGWRQAYVVLGGIMAAYFIPVSIFVMREPRRAPTKHGRPAHHSGWLFRDAVRTRAFWVLNLAIALMWVAQVGFMTHGQPFFEWRDFTPEAAAAVVGFAALTATAFRLFAGVILDRMRSAQLFALVVSGLGAAALIVLLLPVTEVTLAVFLLLWGIGSGAAIIQAPVLTADSYGQRSLGTVLAFTEVTGGVGSVGGPIIGGVLYDSTGSYVPSFVVFAVAFLLSGACFAIFATARKHSRPASERTPAADAAPLVGGLAAEALE